MRIQSLFVHDRLLLGVLSDPQKSRLIADVERYERVTSPEGARAAAYEDALLRMLGERKPPELAVLEASGVDLDNELVMWTQAVYVRRADSENVHMQGKLDVAKDVKVSARFSFSRLLGSSARTEIFGRRRLTTIGYARHEEDEDGGRSIAVTPVFVGRVDFSGESDDDLPFIGDKLQIYPQQVEQFAPLPGSPRLTSAEIAAVSLIPEAVVKLSFASIIGEPYVEKDWGGEKSDLFTNRLIIDGAPTTAAFAFKGPGQRGKLIVKGMGKNSDQALRLAEEPAGLMIVQHHAQIDAQVVNLMSSLARAKGKRFMIIDGADTALILRDRGGLKLDQWTTQENSK